VQNVVTYDAVIDVDNSELKLRPGMTANISFVFANKDDVLRVTNAALRFRPSPDLVSALKLEMPHGRRSGSDGTSGGPPAGAAGQRVRAAWRRATSHPIDARSGCCAMICPARFASRPAPATAAKTEVVEGPLQPGDLVISDATLRRVSKRLPRGPECLPGAGPPPGGPRRF